MLVIIILYKFKTLIIGAKNCYVHVNRTGIVSIIKRFVKLYDLLAYIGKWKSVYVFLIFAKYKFMFFVFFF